MNQYDTVIKNGTIIDGTGLPRFHGDIAIRHGRIAKIGRIDASQAREVIDASGLIVAPGFVDLHTHYDAQVHWDPYCTISGWHGVTSVAIGNCGFGFAGAPRSARTAVAHDDAHRADPLRINGRRHGARLGLGDLAGVDGSPRAHFPRASTC
ncbi:MAG: amidohydrolase family protein [Proteobacteria bacterium]|nr:amidohydrolase family protein [Pseudomonadota bacterium]